MCGRYALTTSPEVLAALLHLHWLRYGLVNRYNIAPTQDVAVVRAGKDGERELVPMHWGTFPLLTGTPSDLKALLAGSRVDVLELDPGATAE